MRSSALIFCLLAHLAHLHQVSAVQLPSQYDTVWNTQSNNSAGSMPVGGGDVGLNVWVESGDVIFYIAKSGAFDENNSLLKLGRVRLNLSPNPFATDAKVFEQRLHINDGYISVQGDNNSTVKIWVDANTSGIHTEVASAVPLNMTASFETWRSSGYQMVKNEQQQTSWGIISVAQIPLPYQYPDKVSFVNDSILSYHHNDKTPLFDFQAVQQNLSEPTAFYNPMKDNTFGIFMYSPDLGQGPISNGSYLETKYTSYSLVSEAPKTRYALYVGSSQEQTTDVESWKQDLIQSTYAMARRCHSQTKKWWHAYWDRSHIIINPEASPADPGFQVGKNYQYFRYMMGCNAKGKFPTRFNGGLFTFDPVLTDQGLPFTPDYRKWSGGTFTAQNQRLLYWPLLKTGDFDIMNQQFNFYSNILPNSRRLAKQYFGLDAGYTSEQIDNTGLPNVYEYDAKAYSDGATRTSLYPPGVLFNDYLSYVSDTANEFADMVLMAKSYGGINIDPWVSFVEYQLAWFDGFYQQRNGLDPNGSLILYPASGAETYKLAFNPSSTISGLRRCILDILSAGLNFQRGNETYYTQFLHRLPQTPLQACPGAESLTCIAPAVNFSFAENNEPTAMYPVFPWGEYGLGQPTNLSYAMHTYFNDSQSQSYHGTDGWRQDQIWFARMGLTDLAMQNTVERLSDSTTYRFSAFKGPNYDWSPDMNHYGSAAIGLQEMLMQTFARNNTQIRLLPAWPANWTGSFKLLAPQQTTVSGNINGRNISDLAISPESRMKDVIFHEA